MSATSVSDRPQRVSTRRQPPSRDRRPLLALIGGCLLIALGAGLIAAHVSVFALDETLIEQSAVHYSSGLPHSLFHDLDARATNRLYSLVLSVAFRLFSGAHAVRVDHVLSVFMFVSAAIPIYLMARVVLRSQWAAVAVALLSVAVPWLTLTSALYTENLSYPLFWWVMLATCNAVWRPSIPNDVLALLSIALLVCTRVQFAAMFVGYLVALTAAAVWRADGSRGPLRRLGSAGAGMLRRYPLALALLAGAVAVFVYEQTSGKWEHEVERLLGAYSNVVIRNGVASNMVEGLLVELIALALGVGLLPAIVSLVWYAKRMSRPQLDKRWVFLAASGVMLFWFLLLTVFSQNGYLGSGTEERYFFYVIPVFWLGTFAALREQGIKASELLACSVGLAALYGAIPFLSALNEETAFLAPAQSIVPHILTQRMNQLGLTGLSMQDALALLVVLAGIATAYIWRHRPGMRAGWTVGVAVALQLVMTGYAFAVIDGKVQGLEGRTGGNFAGLGWVDYHARSPNVMWVDNLSAAAPPISNAAPSTDDQERSTLFWNSRLTSWAVLPELGLPSVNFPMSALPGLDPLEVNRKSGLLIPQAATVGMHEVVGATNSQFLQLAGSTIAQSPDGVLTLTALSKPVRAVWLATGLQSNGYIAGGPPVHVYAFTNDSTKPAAIRVTLTIAPPPSPTPTTTTHSSIVVRIGSASQKIVLKSGSLPRRVSLTTCVAAGHRVAKGTIAATQAANIAGSRVAGTLEGVTIAAARQCRGSSS